MLEVGISDHHSLIITALKSQLVKENAKTKLYCDYSEFDMDNFKAELDDKLKSGVVNFRELSKQSIQIFKTFLYKFSIIMLQQRKNFCVLINSPFMTKTLNRLLCTGVDWKIYISVKEMIKIGKTIRSKEIFVWPSP